MCVFTGVSFPESGGVRDVTWNGRAEGCLVWEKRGADRQDRAVETIRAGKNGGMR